MNFEAAKQKRFVYPMATEFPTTKKMVNSFWAKMSFRLEIPSFSGNCVACWKKGQRKLMTAFLENPNMFELISAWEIKYGDFVPQTRLDLQSQKGGKIELPIRFFRHNMSVEEIIAESEFPFQKAKDNRFDYQVQLSLWDSYLDSDNGCSESCEVF